MDNDIKGNKNTCSKCETKYYDFNKIEVVCPKCGEKKTAKVAFEEKETTNRKDKDDIEVKKILEEDLDIIEEDNEDKDDDHIINVE